MSVLLETIELLALVYFSAMSSAEYCSLLYDEELLVAISCALKPRIPVFGQG